MTARIPWNDYFMKLAFTVAERSTCLRRKVGALAVRDNRILATGYNGSPSGIPNCVDRPDRCVRQALSVPSGSNHELCHAVHAEQNLIIQSMLAQTTLIHSTIYLTTTPCYICAKMLAACQVKLIYCAGKYPDAFSMELFRDANISIIQLNPSAEV